MDDFFAALQIDITDEFHINQPAIFGSQRQVFVANIFILLQRFEGFPAGSNILECADLPEFSLDKLFARISQQLDQEWVHIRDSACLSVQKQDPILGGFEQAAVAEL